MSDILLDAAWAHFHHDALDATLTQKAGSPTMISVGVGDRNT
jgi:hypothetical protein